MKIDKDSPGYTFLFAFAVCVVCALLLSGVAKSLAARQKQNAGLEVQKSILRAARVRPEEGGKLSARDISSLFEEHIRSVSVNSRGDLQDSLGEEAYPLYVYEEHGRALAYIFPVEGRGLWGRIHGFFALEPDGKTVRGLAFDEHGETPGLGGEIEEESFLKGFYGKKIWDDEARQLVSVTIAKGRAVDRVPPRRLPYYVDGISGATLTGDGINLFLKETLMRYEPFFRRIRERGGL